MRPKHSSCPLASAPPSRTGLIASLDEGPEDDPTEVEFAWEEEIRKRLDAYRRAEVQPISSDEVFAKARALLK